MIVIYHHKLDHGMRMQSSQTNLIKSSVRIGISIHHWLLNRFIYCFDFGDEFLSDVDILTFQLRYLKHIILNIVVEVRRIMQSMRSNICAIELRRLTITLDHHILIGWFSLIRYSLIISFTSSKGIMELFIR
jgi:hypothetical protein